MQERRKDTQQRSTPVKIHSDIQFNGFKPINMKSTYPFSYFHALPLYLGTFYFNLTASSYENSKYDSLMCKYFAIFLNIFSGIIH